MSYISFLLFFCLAGFCSFFLRSSFTSSERREKSEKRKEKRREKKGKLLESEYAHIVWTEMGMDIYKYICVDIALLTLQFFQFLDQILCKQFELFDIAKQQVIVCGWRSSRDSLR